MNILVTGATGFIGKRLVELLLEEGHNIKCIVRETSDINHLKKNNVQIFTGSILNETFLNSIKPVDLIFHLAAIRGEKNLPLENYETINVSGTEKLLKIFDKCKFIFCSTVGVMGYGKGLNENSPLKPQGNYHITKASAENLCKEHNNCTIVRPAITYGKGDRDGFLYKLITLIKKKKFLIVGNGKNKIHMVYIDNLVRGLIHLGEKGKRGEIYIIADKTSLTLREITGIIEKKFNTTLYNIYIPRIFADAGSIIFQSIYTLFFPGKEPFLSKSKVDIISLDQEFIIDKLLNSGYRPEMEIEKGIEEEIEWIQKEKI